MIQRPFVSVLLHRLRERNLRPQVILGPRQVGKTTGIQQAREQIRGVSYYASADDTLAQTRSWIQDQWRAALDKGPNVTLFLDEIQKIENWSETIKSLWDAEGAHPRLKLVLSGSSSLTLQTGLTESLAGRFELISVPHWGFLETQAAFRCSLETYLLAGGYPGAQRYFHDFPRWFSYVKSTIIDRVIDQDILRHRTVAKPALFRQAFEILSGYPAQEISFTKLLGQIQDRGNTDLIKHYLDLFEGAFLFKTLQKFSTRHLSVKSSSPKIIPLCPALVTLATGRETAAQPENRGRIFEAVAGATLLQIPNAKVFYWREGADEIDFVLTVENQLYGIEIKSGHKKKIQGRDAFLAHFPTARMVLITMENYPDFAKDPLPFLENRSIVS